MKTLCVLTVLSIGTAVFSDPSVWFAKEEGIGFALIRGAEVLDPDYVSDYPSPSMCHCRRRCFVTPNCNGASYAEEADTTHCRTFSGGFISNSFGLKDNSTLMLWNTTSHWFHIGLDGRLYLVLGTKFSISQAKPKCEHFPGFHLGVYKDERSTEALREIHESFVSDDVAISLRNGNPPHWPDDTPFQKFIYQIDTSGSGSFFLLQGDKFMRTGSVEVYVVCQADLQNGKH